MVGSAGFAFNEAKLDGFIQIFGTSIDTLTLGVFYLAQEQLMGQRPLPTPTRLAPIFTLMATVGLSLGVEASLLNWRPIPPQYSVHI